MKPKLKLLVKSLPKFNYNITKAAENLGYSKSYSDTLIHKTIRKYIGVKSDEEIKDTFLIELDKDIKRFKREKDNTNYLRAKELKSKTLGLLTDRTIVDNKNPDTIILVDKTKTIQSPTIKEETNISDAVS